MRRIRKTLLVTILFVLGLTTVVSAKTNERKEMDVYITSLTSAYDSPSKNANEIYDALGCTKLKASQYDDDWFVVSQGGEDVYVKSDYVSDEDPAFAGRTITSSSKYSFLFNDGVSDEKFKFIEETFNSVPENLIKDFEEKGWKAYVTDRDIDSLFFYGDSSSLGTALFDRKEIWLSNRISSNDTIVHEFGHYIDGANSDASFKEEFVVLHSEEVNSFSSYHKTASKNYDSPYEYFAEAYSEMILNPETFKKNCPKTYDYISSYISKF